MSYLNDDQLDACREPRLGTADPVAVLRKAAAGERPSTIAWDLGAPLRDVLDVLARQDSDCRAPAGCDCTTCYEEEAAS